MSLLNRDVEEIAHEMERLSESVRNLTDLLEIEELKREDAVCLAEELRVSLAEALLKTSRVERLPPISKNLFEPPRYGWTKWTLKMADLCGLDLSDIDPNSYGRHGKVKRERS